MHRRRIADIKGLACGLTIFLAFYGNNNSIKGIKQQINHADGLKSIM